MPTVFAEPVRTMKPGDVSDVLRSANGFHIVKVLETRSRDAPTIVEQTHARHILIKVNEIVSDSEAKARIERIRDRIETAARSSTSRRSSTPTTAAPPRAATSAGSRRATRCRISSRR